MTTSQLERARLTEMPDRESMLRRDPSVQQFWVDNRDLLRDAWREWDEALDLPFALDSSLLDPELRSAVEAAWEDPTRESAVTDLMHEAAPSLFSFQFFDPDRIGDLRTYLEQAWNAEIPLRPPYGILLNRGGAMLDARSEGYLAAPTFQAFYQDLLDRYMRPISRLLFPEIMGYDTQTFGFSINYKPNTDTSIRPHTDASAVTLNINVNTPDEQFTGSAVDFFDHANNETKSLTFEPGTAMLHRGNIAHTAHPITSGERTNLVLWLYGDRGQVPHLVSQTQAPDIDAASRWTVPTTTPDRFAPF